MNKEDQDKTKGLYQKYQVKKLNDDKGKHKNCSFYVLDLNHDKFAIPALQAYIEACDKEYHLLACDLNNLVLKHSPPKEKKEFVPATKFQLELRHKDKECLIPVVIWLLSENASHQFEWKMDMLENSEEYVLYIETAWADNLVEIAKLLGDYGQNFA